MARRKRVFISDIHLSSKARYQDKKHPSWYKPEEHEKRLLAFLDNFILERDKEIKDVVLLGDIFNNWVCPADQAPPTYTEILEDNPGPIGKFKEIAEKGINLFFANGNHDFDLNEGEIQGAIPGITVIKQYRSGRIYAEHGHQFDIFNKVDFASDPAFGRPIGYFISRLVSSIEGNGYGILDLPTYVDDLVEAAITSQNIYSSIIEGLAERAGLNEDASITMPDSKSVKIGELKERYAVLGEVYSVRELVKDLYDRRYLHGPADRLCQRYDFHVVIFGHTHNATIDKDFFLVADRIYANTGSWCKDNAYFVEIEKIPKPTTSRITVRLCGVDKKGNVSTKRKEEIS